MKSAKPETNNAPTATIKEKTSPEGQPKTTKEETSMPSKKQPEDKSKVIPPNQTLRPEK